MAVLTEAVYHLVKLYLRSFCSPSASFRSAPPPAGDAVERRGSKEASGTTDHLQFTVYTVHGIPASWVSRYGQSRGFWEGLAQVNVSRMCCQVVNVRNAREIKHEQNLVGRINSRCGLLMAPGPQFAHAWGNESVLLEEGCQVAFVQRLLVPCSLAVMRSIT